MYNAGKIILGLLIFIGIMASPFVLDLGKGNAKPSPSIDTPVIKAMAKPQCIESRETMKTEHMKILNDWRDAVVRGDKRLYVASDRKEYNMSLQNTCMHCHSNKANFCDSCHGFVGAKPYCWDCHIVPKDSADVTPAAKSAPAVAAAPGPIKVHFAVGKRDIPAEAQHGLAALAAYLQKNASAGVVISGYTDKTGNPKKNEELAKNRAKAVREVFRAAGISDERIVMKKPEVITGGADNAEARRVDVSIAEGKGV
ncbi:MAG TPA: sulfate reduction electron transfer complex DsrMKJOP subunit DsrJ [Dissulfurispiraceae bacterium]|nr:sulfate reduction electron transfer complex DsrMKJOP subunit DsrJ [Dissulfurispiraceae bacterium]